MKIAYKKMSTVVEILPDKVTSLVVESAQALYQLLMELKLAMEGCASEVVISEDEKPLAVEKKVILLTDFVNFTLNQKSLLTKIIGELDKISKEGSFYQDSQKILAEIENYIMKLTLDFPCELVCEKLTMSNMLKGIGIIIADEYDSLEERILAYMDLARELEGKELFIFVNLRCLIPQERLELMLDTALKREHKILLIDNVEYPKLDQENRIVIDADLCEI